MIPGVTYPSPKPLSPEEEAALLEGLGEGFWEVRVTYHGSYIRLHVLSPTESLYSASAPKTVADFKVWGQMIRSAYQDAFPKVTDL